MGDEITWVFDRTPPSGARRGGNPSEHAFDQDFETFVREVLQNSNDQGVDAPVEVTFHAKTLEGEALESFLNSIGWEVLEPHLESVAKTDRGAGLANFLKELDHEEQMTILAIEDSNTEGLTGPESGEDSNFTALCKDDLISHKKESKAGGTYGLGKSVLWSFSGIRTVIFNSWFPSDGNEQHDDPPRLVGRSELPSHQLDETWFDGSGWFGLKKGSDEAAWAQSVWGDSASTIAEDLLVPRDGSQGTSILIMGFRDPTGSDLDPQQIVQKTGEAARKYFWPSMMGADPRLDVFVETSESREKASYQDNRVEPFAECVEAFMNDDLSSELESPGDIVKETIDVEIPDKRDGTTTSQGEATLLVRLAEEGSDHDLLNRVAIFRGSGMVVDYWNRSNLAIGARPFHAVLITGEGHILGRELKEGDKNLEEFLRLSEPPSHQEWTSTRSLKDTYKQGYWKAIQTLDSDVKDYLRKLVVPQPREGERGPDLLRKRFPIGASSGGGRPTGEEPFHFERLRATFEQNRWNFEGKIKANTDDHEGWEVKIELFPLGEEGQRFEAIPIESLSVDTPGTAAVLSGNRARVKAEKDVQEVHVKGSSQQFLSSPDDQTTEVTEVAVRVEGSLIQE